MNRTLLRGAGYALAALSIFSCSTDSLTGTDGLNTDDLSADATIIASVTVTFGSSSIAVGDTTTAKATLRDWHNRILANRVVTWSSSDNSVATVSTAGLVTGTGAGTAVITAARAGKSGSASITVTSLGTTSGPAVATVSVSLAAGTLNPGQTTQATAVTRDSANNVLSGRVVTWSSSNTAVATVSGAGLVTAVAAGTSQITGTSEGKSGSAGISVTTGSSVTTNPGTVQNLSVSATDTTSATLSFTQVDNGAGQPASYEVRFTVGTISWGSAAEVTSGTCATPLAGTAIGSPMVCKVLGLKPSTGYNFQVLAFRGTLNQDAVFGQLSNVAAGTTKASSAPPPVPVASVTISPASVSIQVGATAQLTATTRDASNNILTGRTVTWASANTALATVSASGLVSAKAAGTVQITATSEGKTATATAMVTAAPPPPPPGSSNEPSGMTLIRERAFNSLQEDPSWDTDPQMQIIQDAMAPKSPANVMRFTFPAGFSADGNSNGHSGVSFGGTNRVMYISYWAKYSANWQGHSTGINKHVYAWNGNDPLFVMEAEGAGSAALVPRPALQRLVKGDGMYEPNLVPTAVIPRGVWFHIEVVLNGNTSGNANGSMDWWLNGVHVGSVSGLQWSSGTTNWHIFEIYPVWGGVGGTAVQSTMTFDWDHVYLSGKP